jgi:hypothetical protein
MLLRDICNLLNLGQFDPINRLIPITVILLSMPTVLDFRLQKARHGILHFQNLSFSFSYFVVYSRVAQPFGDHIPLNEQNCFGVPPTQKFMLLSTTKLPYPLKRYKITAKPLYSNSKGGRT